MVEQDNVLGVSSDELAICAYSANHNIEQFARTEASYVVVRVLQTFDQIENLDHGPLRMHHTIENRSGSGVQVRLHAASPAFVEKLSETDSDLDLGLGAQRKVSIS